MPALLHYQENVLFPEVTLTLNEAFFKYAGQTRWLSSAIGAFEGNGHRGRMPKVPQTLPRGGGGFSAPLNLVMPLKWMEWGSAFSPGFF